MSGIKSDFLIGLDLGQAQDYTAMTIFERFFGERPQTYHLRHLERFKLGTPYPEQVARAKSITEKEPLLKRCHLIIDATGAGRPVLDMFRQARILAPIVAITITGGDSVSGEKNELKVPKRDLVSALQVLFQTGRLKVAKAMENADILVQELLNFKVEITIGGHDKYEAWREGVHDDLVLSAALACWYGEWKQRGPIGKFQPVSMKRRHLDKLSDRELDEYEDFVNEMGGRRWS